MLDIFYTVITFSSMLILFKYFEKLGVNNLQAIIVNYFTAGILALLNTRSDGITIDFQEIINSSYFSSAFIIGLLFIILFNLLAFATQKIGLAVTTVANKMAMIVPVIFGIYVFSENLDLLKVIGFLLAIIAIYLTSTKNGKLGFDKRYLLLVILIFVGQGLADSTLSWTEKTILNPENSTLFFASIFIISGTLGSLFLVYNLTKNKAKLKLRNLLWGIILGVPNYLTLYFFVKALKSEIFESSQVFPIVNMGVIILSAITGIILFKEKLTKSNWGGIGLAIIAIALITFSNALIMLL